MVESLVSTVEESMRDEVTFDEDHSDRASDWVHNNSSVKESQTW